MKKLILFLSALSLVFTSCSSDADPLPVIEPVDTTVNTSSVLLRKIITTESGLVETTDITYNGYKIVKIDFNNGDYESYTYTNNLITKVEIYSNSTIEERQLYEYNSNNKLIKYTSLQYPNFGQKIFYTHNSDGSISYQEYYGDLVVQNNIGNSGKIYSNKIEEVSVTSPSITYTRQFSYDGKNNPIKNALGIDKIWFVDTRLAYDYTQNVLSEKVKNSSNNQIQDIHDNVYTYNINNFPTVQIETNHTAGGNVVKYEYFY